MITLPSPKTMPDPVRLVFRPILFLALGLHALLLFTPVPSQERPPEPADKKDPLKISQLPTAKPASAKPATTVKSAPPPARPAAPARPAPLSTSPAPPPLTSPVTGASAPSSLANIQSGAFPPTNGSTNAEETTIAARGADVDPERVLYELLADLPVPDKLDPAFTNVATAELLGNPDLFYQPPSDPDLAPEPLPGLESSPLFAPGEEPDYLYSTLFDQPLKQAFEEVSKVGEYGGGPLYKLTRGTYIRYLSLVPSKERFGAIVSIWKTDPRSRKSGSE
jgi:hypothetical protein